MHWLTCWAIVQDTVAEARILLPVLSMSYVLLHSLLTRSSPVFVYTCAWVGCTWLLLAFKQLLEATISSLKSAPSSFSINTLFENVEHHLTERKRAWRHGASSVSDDVISHDQSHSRLSCFDVRWTWCWKLDRWPYRTCWKSDVARRRGRGVILGLSYHQSRTLQQ